MRHKKYHQRNTFYYACSSVVIRRFNFLNSAVTNSATTIPAPMSAIGPAYKMPFNPSVLPKMMMSGISRITCRIMERIVALSGYPLAWKYPVAAIWKPAVKIPIRKIRIDNTANSVKSGSLSPKIERI